jgi:hypothetical protein
LEDEHEKAVGGADRERVEDDRRPGDHDRPEHDREEDEGQQQHEGDHPWRGIDDRVEVVEVLGGRPAD